MDDFVFVNSEAQELFSHAREFEILIQELFRDSGFSVTDVSGRGERGADFIASKHGKRVVCQVKCSTRKVRKSAVKQVLRARDAYGAEEAVVITNSTFTPHALKHARMERVGMYDGNKLLPKLSDVQVAQLRSIERRAVELAPRIARF